MALLFPTSAVAAQFGGLVAPLIEEESDPVISRTYLGTPVYSNLIFSANPNTPENEDLILNTVIMVIQRRKNIVKTELQGRDGTVKEYINKGDYQVLIRGEIVSELPLVFPVDLVTALRNVLDLPSTIEVAGNFLSVFDVDTLVIETYEIGEKAGFRGSVPFRIQAISDDPIELQINA